MSDDTARATPSAWAPLRVRAFRFLWITQLFSLIGTWMQTVGAQWLLVDEPNAATLVGLVQAAAMLPTLVLALPAGALADIVDRRRLLIAVQLFQVAVGAALTVLAATGHLPPALLLTATFLLGCGTTLMIPGYQTLVQELVGRDQARSAAALNGVAMNLARAVGPAVAGLLIAQAGVSAVFALNALTYAAMAAVLVGLRPPRAQEQLLPERFGGALVAGARYVRHSPAVRRLLLRTLLFVVPGSALWALLPLVASRLLGLDALGYGLLLGALGIGAVTGAAVLPHVVARLSPTRLVLFAGLVFGTATIVCALAPHLVVALVALVPAGLAWLCMLATMNGTLQVFLPGWVRARGLSIYQMVFAGGQAVASLIWGVLAEWLGLVPTLLVAGGLLALGALTVAVWPLHDVSGLDRDPAVYWPEPHLELDPELEDGPVLVTVSYTVSPENMPRFLEAMVPVRRMKMRTGATSYAVYRDAADPTRFVEVSQYPNWAEHLRQHGGRLTGSDQELEDVARAFADGPPRIEHLLPTRAGEPGETV
ncbi:MFS transporter [Pseudonocardia bannensis]|uniref:MFS transporter n=1 Tax=Pseudonocardia bannensis TaxID=630973 RepID=A0A848DIQ4_9PSEU|nr:MFS transporter [Pseudonocardia bannensis]NMH92577.1 MFS transporter [Pseudonocardia bannensis]